MVEDAPPEIKPDWTLQQLQDLCPGVELTLFSHFGIGSRERSGFSGKELLSDLLRRHLVFDFERACRHLTTLAREDWSNSWSADQLHERFEQPSVRVIDARGPEEHRRCPFPGSDYLSATVVEELRANISKVTLVMVCADGTQSPAASRVMRKQGFSAVHLRGGLKEWSYSVDPRFPILYPLQEKPGFWYLLADGETLRFRRKEQELNWGWRLLERSDLATFESGNRLLTQIPELRQVMVTPRSFSLRGPLNDLPAAIQTVTESILKDSRWSTVGAEGDPEQEAVDIDRVLKEEAPKVLANHKGTVVAEDYQDRVLTLALGGGCAGCASAQVTTQRDLAALLYSSVPLLDGIRNSEASSSG